MLTIGQLASYAGVTIRAVRHYHQVGLLPEPERDVSGYRTYDATAVVRLIRIRTLAEAGVPLARVQELLDADAATFAEGTAQIDRELRAQIRGLQEHRRRIAQLASGDSLAVPDEVADYLDMVRAIGAPESLIEAERDAWILVAARYPDQIAAFMDDKVRQLEDPRTVRFYQLIAQMLTGEEDRCRSISSGRWPTCWWRCSRTRLPAASSSSRTSTWTTPPSCSCWTRWPRGTRWSSGSRSSSPSAAGPAGPGSSGPDATQTGPPSLGPPGRRWRRVGGSQGR